MNETILQLSEVSRTFGKQVKAVDALTLGVEQGEFMSLLGPSGCGKTTTLRLIAGLETPDAGEIAYQGVVVASRARRIFVPPEKRHMGMVFQSYAIWPHLTVFENVAYALKIRRVPAGVIREKVLAMLDAVNLTGLANRQATQLSGGQQQRVALARALVHEPKLLLLDEPFSNLDAALREQMRVEMKLLQKRLGVTMILVTHDQTEALSLSDRIAVMRAGRCDQIGTPQLLYREPRTPYVRDFLSRVILLEGVVEASEGGEEVTVRLRDTGQTVRLRALAEGSAFGASETVHLAIRPECVRLSRPTLGPRPGHTLEGKVEALLFMGQRTEARVQLPSGQTALLPLSPFEELREGDSVAVECPPEHLTLWRV
jgi:iron(III) transport system ATP-binding protein